MLVARGPGPTWFRIVLAVVAAIYVLGLLWHPPQKGALKPLVYFTECTCLFPSSNAYTIDYRLEGWSCDGAGWQPLDPRTYFPLEADDKESRFQRVGHFYGQNRIVMQALDEYVTARHAAHAGDDAIAGPIGGIRLFKVQGEIPPPGTPVDRYVYRPLAPVTGSEIRKDLYWTKTSVRKARCEAATK